MKRRGLLFGILLAAWPAPPVRAAHAPARILYASDWNGPTQIFAADLSGRVPLGQLTFARTTRGGRRPDRRERRERDARPRLRRIGAALASGADGGRPAERRRPRPGAGK